MDKEQLNAKIDRWDGLGSWFAFSVCIGLALEAIASKLPISAKDWCPPIIANILVVGGVTGEWFSHRRQSIAARMLSLIQEQESEQLRLDVAKANQCAAEAAVELEKIKLKQAPWDFSHHKQMIFSQLLHDAPKGKVVVPYSNSDVPRSSDFAFTLTEVLRNAGYDVSGYAGGFTSAGAPLFGVVISIKNDSEEVLRERLQRAFREIKIDSRLENRNPADATFDDDAVVIRIGIKP